MALLSNFVHVESAANSSLKTVWAGNLGYGECFLKLLPENFFNKLPPQTVETSSKGKWNTELAIQ